MPTLDFGEGPTVGIAHCCKILHNNWASISLSLPSLALCRSSRVRFVSGVWAGELSMAVVLLVKIPFYGLCSGKLL